MVPQTAIVLQVFGGILMMAVARVNVQSEYCDDGAMSILRRCLGLLRSFVAPELCAKFG